MNDNDIEPITNKENIVETTIFDERLLFTQLGITLYENNRHFRNIQIRKLANDEQRSFFVHISTTRKYAKSIENNEFRKSLESIESAVFQDEKIVAAVLYPLHDEEKYQMYEYPIGEELILFNSSLANDIYCTENTESTETKSNDSTLSLESFDIPEDWDTCTDANIPLKKYWCMFLLNCKKYSKVKEDKIQTLLYTLLDERHKDILNIDKNVCYRVIFQHPELHKSIKQPRIYFMEVNKIYSAESVEEKSYIEKIPREKCILMSHLTTLSVNDEIRNTFCLPKYIGETKTLLAAWEKSICQPTHIGGIQIVKGSYHRLIYNPFRMIRYFASQSTLCIYTYCKKLYTCIHTLKTIKHNNSIFL